MKTIEKKIQKIDDLYKRMAEISNQTASIRLTTYGEVAEYCNLCDESRKCENTAHRLIKNLMKDFNLQLTFWGRREFKKFDSYAYKELFSELKSRYNRAKEVLCGYDRYSSYTIPNDNTESQSA